MGEIVELMKEEVGRLLSMDADQIDTSASLLALGLDSMALTQFRGVLSDTYGTEIEEALFFDEKTTLKVIADYIKNGPPPVTVEIQPEMNRNDLQSTKDTT